MAKKAAPARNAPTARRTASRAAGRRHPLASIALILIGLISTGGAYALFTGTASADTAAAHASLVDEGQKLFAANCATCHGLSLEGTDTGPTLIGVGAAAVDFQVGTGRMPAAATGPQAEQKPVQFTDAQVKALAAYVGAVSPGPAIPSSDQVDGEGADSALGAELFRINCAMCHNVAGAGGALTQGKFAPSLVGTSSIHAFEAMETGPQNMPVFSDLNISPEEKENIIAYLQFLQENPSPGGIDLGNLGPVSEGLFIWIFGLGAIIGVTIWLTAKSN